MSLNWTIEQLKSWIEATFPDNVARSITEADLRDVLNKTVDWVFETNSEAFIQAAIIQIEEKRVQAVQVLEDASDIKSEIIGERTLTQAARVAAENAVANAVLGQNPLGEYNPGTNTPALSETPAAGIAVGSFYDITVEGVVAFSGSNFDESDVLAVGGRLIKKNNTNWYYQPPSNLALVKAIHLEGKLGGEVKEGEEKMVSGNTIFHALPIFEKIRTSQLFDSNNYEKNLSFGSTNANTSLPDAATTKYINIPVTETTLSYSGLGSSVARRIAWMNGENGAGTLVVVTTVDTPSKTVPIPVGAKSFRFFFQRPEDGDRTGSFMLNFGALLEWEPYAYIKGVNNYPLAEPDPAADGQIIEGEERPVSGDRVYKALPVFEKIRTWQLFDSSNYEKNLSFGSTNGNTSLPGAATTKYINIPVTETTLSYSGLGSSVARRIAWMNGENGSGTLVVVNTVNTPSGTVPIPTGAKSFRFFFQRPEDGDRTGSFTLNFGALLEWEPYAYIGGINNLPLYVAPPRRINHIYAVLNGASPVVNESGWYRCCPVVPDNATMACTGYTYDIKRDLHVVSEYNKNTSSRLLFFRPSDLVDRNLDNPAVSTPHKVYDVTAYIDHLQGCAWDWVADRYLLLGTKKGASPGGSNSVIVCLSASGNVLDIIELGNSMTVEVGMIDVLLDGSIVVKPNTGSSAYIFNRSGQLVNRVSGLLGNEGIAVNKYTGDVWCAGNAFLMKKYDRNWIEQSSFSYNTFTNESSGSNVEGMAVMRDGSIVVCADAYYHGGTPLGNALFFFDPESTVNKRKYFYLPNGLGGPDTGYISEVIETPNSVTEVVVSCNFNERKSYRSGQYPATIANAEFSENIVNNTLFQVRIG